MLKLSVLLSKGLTIEQADGERLELHGDQILLSAGRRAVTKGLRLESH